MKYIFICCFSCLAVSCSNKPQPSIAKRGLIFPTGERITNDNFIGTAYLHPMVVADSVNTTSVGNVTFEAGARTKWHLHPGGQILLATGGVGYYQEKGRPKIILRKGNVISCSPNIPHWHGASADTAFVQIAITNTRHGPTIWLEPVSDSVYLGPGQ